MGQLLEAFGNLGVKHQSTNGKCPLSLTGPIRGGFTEVDGTSSQFLTALLFSTPLALGDSEIKVRNLNEVPYVEITLDWLHRQEINFDYTPNYDSFKVKGGQKYRPFNSVIPADFSTATFPLVAAAVCRGNVKIKNLDFSDRQGDKAVFNYLEQMGMKVKLHTEFTGVSCEETLKGMDLNLNSTPDALPAMAVTACFAEGTTKIHNVAQARIKETDRIACMTQELRKMGADITELEDGMIINGSKLHGAEVEGHDDHRIVMALAIAGMGAEGETKIKGAEAASVTYPDFIRDFTAMGANFTTEG
jgi:3-phosphoshikimate 1-carboxyvinyltransferase